MVEIIDGVESIVMSLGGLKAASRGALLGIERAQVYELRTDARKNNDAVKKGIASPLSDKPAPAVTAGSSPESREEKGRQAEYKRIEKIADSVRSKVTEASSKARQEYLDSHPTFNPEKDFNPGGLSLNEQKAIHSMGRTAKARQASEAAAERVKESEAQKLPEKDRYLAGAKKYPAPGLGSPILLQSTAPKTTKPKKEESSKNKSLDRSSGYVRAGNGTITGSADNDRRLLSAREKKASGRSLSRSDEVSLSLNESRAKADPSKWNPGDGVGYKVSGDQINRGFRVQQVDPNTKMATVRQVADTGLTSSGGNNDRIKPQLVHVADLVKDSKYKK